ncbi:hypothetical protein PTI98_001329 [Pleurotus ostreatus]|nr:hypothetical protein PTI98_001329 [Pleurotus ostreatus]
MTTLTSQPLGAELEQGRSEFTLELRTVMGPSSFCEIKQYSGSGNIDGLRHGGGCNPKGTSHRIWPNLPLVSDLLN